MIHHYFFFISLLFVFQYVVSLNDEPHTEGETRHEINSFRIGNIRYDKNSGVVTSMYNVNYVTRGGGAEERANDFLTNNRKVLNIAENKEEEGFKIISTRKIAVWTIVRFMQTYKGVPVYDSSIAISINEDNIVRMVTSSYTKGVFLKGEQTKPIRTMQNILNKVTNKYDKEGTQNIVINSSDIVIYHVGKGDNRLAWKINLAIKANENFAEMETIYDDATGEILLEVDKTMDKNGNKEKFLKQERDMNDKKTEKSLYLEGEYVEKKDNFIAEKSKHLRGVTNWNITENERLLEVSRNNESIGILKRLSSIFDIYKCNTPPPSQVPSQVPSLSPSLSSLPSITSSPSVTFSPSISELPSSFPSEVPTRPPFNENIIAGYVFDPDPLSTANKKYCDTGFCDNEDANTRELSEQLILVELLNITTINGTNYLKGPYAEIVDVEGKHGLYEQKSYDFRFNRSNPAFEAVSCYFHVDKYMRYLNEELNLGVMPYQYDGGVKCDPHATVDDNSFFDSSTGILYFGSGGVDDAEDASVIIHELGHGVHNWITDNNLSQQQGLSEGFGDYLTASYLRSLMLNKKNETDYYWIFKWDGHNDFWNGRDVNNQKRYPIGLSLDIYQSGAMWSSVNMEIWDKIGRHNSDKVHLMGIAATNRISDQEDAANAVYMASFDLGLDFGAIKTIYERRGYSINNFCGDGIVSDGEECDGDIGNATCADIGCSTGILTCGSDCMWNYTQCASNEELVWEMDLTFDLYPRETIWALYSNTDNPPLASGGSGEEYDNLIEKSASVSRCLDRSLCYTFYLFDTVGDGICCEFGNGIFSLSIDGVPLDLPPFLSGFEVSHTFGTNCIS